jgi:hypothetical protein
MQNFINDSEGTSNSVGTCKLPEDGIDDAETCRSKELRELTLNKINSFVGLMNIFMWDFVHMIQIFIDRIY